MKPLILLIALSGLLTSADLAILTPAPASAPFLTIDEAVTSLGKLPDVVQLKLLTDFVATSKDDEAAKVMVQIAVRSVRPARPLALVGLARREALVIDRSLRALTAVGISGIEQRLQVEALLNHEDTGVVAQAAICLAGADDRRACSALIARLEKSAPDAATPAVANALHRLSGVDFGSDAKAWNDWYQAYRIEAENRLRPQAEQLRDADPQLQLAAIQVLAGMTAERATVVEMLDPYARARDPAVALAARQTLSTLAPYDYAEPSRSEVMDAIKPPPGPPVVAAPRFYEKGLFDTWQGLVLTMFIGLSVLSGSVYLLRSPTVREATKRYVRAVVVASTQRLTRPLTNRIRKHTDRVTRALTKRIEKKARATAGKG